MAWEELRRPSFEKVQATRIVNTRDLRLLDLTSDIYSNRQRDLKLNEKENPSFLFYKVMVWPLVAACSVKVLNRSNVFKPEYIIPQLLLQWVTKNNLDGIKYSSTHIDFNKVRHEGLFYNVVIPVKTFDQDSNYCPKLLKIFKSTEVIPMQLRQFMSIASHLENQPSISFNVNPDILRLELLKGNLQSYSSTYFGVLEHSLKNFQPEAICD